MQDCSISSGLAIELLQSCTKPSTWICHYVNFFFSYLLAICKGKPPATNGFFSKRASHVLISWTSYSKNIWDAMTLMWWCHHDDVMKWKHFLRYWPFVRGIHWSPVNSPHKGRWRGALMFSLIRAWINGRVNNGEAGDLRHHHAHYGVTVMIMMSMWKVPWCATRLH